MAAYAATVTTADSVGQVLAGTPLRLVRGSVDITNYNTTLAEITGITKFFRTTPTVILGGATDNGNIVAWVAASKSIKAWRPRAAHTHDLKVIGGVAEGTTDILHSATADLGFKKEQAGDHTILGVDEATKGGVVSQAAAAGSEVATDVDVGAVEFVAIGVAP